MRVARLLSIMFEIDARPGITAAELAEMIGVSVRTVYRDVDALQQAGIPLYGTSGRNGGLRLVDGYRSRAAALGADEAAALLTGVVPGVAAQLGLDADLDRARRKVRSQSGHVDRRGLILIDPVGWYRTPDDVPHLATLAEALNTQRTVTMRYSRWEQPAEVTRTVAPLGLVLKSAAWYVLARSRRQVRTYRVNQILSARLTSQHYELDPSFDLAASWAAFVADFRQRLHTLDAHVRVERSVRDWIRAEGDPALGEPLNRAVSPADEHDGDVELFLPFESVERATAELLRFGTGVDVLGPPELRRHVASVATALAARYR
jgi:predicted DNA-binding transcriptional regulator YafY